YHLQFSGDAVPCLYLAEQHAHKHFGRRCKMSAKLMEYFNKTPRIGTLSTASKSGQVNAACFGSPRMIDEKTVVMSVRNARTFANLQENPNAVFMIIEPGKTS